jgi:hypothetical protein
MYPYIREWPLEQREGSREAAAATLYGWLLLAYLAWRVSSTLLRTRPSPFIVQSRPLGLP